MMIRPATRHDVINLAGETFPETMRALAIEHEGRVIALAGVRHCNPYLCFSNILPEIKDSPRTVVLMIRRMRNLLDQYARPVYALADKDEATSQGFLKHVGFQHLRSTSQGEVYQWPS